MMGLKWFRFYSEFLHDPKVQIMPEVMRYRLVALFCLHCDELLKDMDDEMLANALRITIPELEEMRETFRKRGFIGKTSWEPRNWDKRQYKSDSSTERTRLYRERLAASSADDVTSQIGHCDVTETPSRVGAPACTDSDSEQIQTRPETDSDFKAKKNGRHDGEPLTPRTPEDRSDVEDAVRLLCLDLRTDSTGMELGRRHNGSQEIQIPGWKWIIAAKTLQGPGITLQQMRSFPYLKGIAKNTPDSEKPIQVTAITRQGLRNPYVAPKGYKQLAAPNGKPPERTA